MFERLKNWIKENAPTLTILYQNKYVQMAYDRFASLPPSRQKTVMGGVIGLTLTVLLGFLISCFINLWSYNKQSRASDEMVLLLQEYEQQRQSQAGEIAVLERNLRIANPGALKQHLIRQASNAKIATRLMEVEEAQSTPPSGDEGADSELQVKQANVKIQRVNLNQLKELMQGIEFGPYFLNVTFLKIQNDDKLRGYMNVEFSVVAYLFQGNVEES